MDKEEPPSGPQIPTSGEFYHEYNWNTINELSFDKIDSSRSN